MFGTQYFSSPFLLVIEGSAIGKLNVFSSREFKKPVNIRIYTITSLDKYEQIKCTPLNSYEYLCIHSLLQCQGKYSIVECQCQVR